MASPEWPPESLLGMLPDVARERLLRRGATVRYPKPGRVLIREHDESRFVIIILSGVVKVTSNAGSGQGTLLAIRVAGDAVGEFAAVDRLPRSATVTTCGPLVAQSMKAEDFLDCLRRDPDISHAVSKAIVAKMRVASQRWVSLGGIDVPGRVARVLLHLVTAYGKPRPEGAHGKAEIDAPLTHEELASLAVASPPAVQRVLRQLRDEGIIATGYRSITVLDIEQLSQVAYGEGGSR